MIAKTLSLILFSAMVVAAAGCEQEGPAERAGAKLDEAVEEGKDSVGDAVERAGDKLEEAGDKIENKTQ